MSMNWTAPLVAREKSGLSWWRRVGATIERRWTAYCQWRIEQIAIKRLNAMTDRELRDIGLVRSEISGAVRIRPTGAPSAGSKTSAPRTKWRGAMTHL